MKTPITDLYETSAVLNRLSDISAPAFKFFSDYSAEPQTVQNLRKHLERAGYDIRFDRKGSPCVALKIKGRPDPQPKRSTATAVSSHRLPVALAQQLKAEAGRLETTTTAIVIEALEARLA